MSKTLQCATHGPSLWRETVMCTGCGEPYQFVPALNAGMSHLLDRRGVVLEEKACTCCGAAFPEALVAICGSCHAAKVAAVGVVS